MVGGGCGGGVVDISRACTRYVITDDHSLPQSNRIHLTQYSGTRLSVKQRYTTDSISSNGFKCTYCAGRVRGGRGGYFISVSV